MKQTNGIVYIALAVAIGALGTTGQTYAQGGSTPVVPATFSGCVQTAPGSESTLILSSKSLCATLKGDISVKKAAGHEIELKGLAKQATRSTPASIDVKSVTKVGKSCSDTCSVQPPGARGLKAKSVEMPGSEGGTPGFTAPQQ